MTFEEAIQEGKFDDAIKLLKAKENVADYAAEYNDNKRDLRPTQVGKRNDKTIKSETVKVAKIPIPFSQDIVRSSSAFLFGSPVKITSKEDIQLILDRWDKLRVDSILLKFTEAVKSETEAAIVFYQVGESKELTLKARLLTSKNGELYPVFDSFGDMIAFGWKYKAFDGDKEYEFFHIWTNEQHYVLKNDSGWKPTEESGPNFFGKIPIVYLSQNEPEWFLVKELIDRYEMNFSKFADTNDYFSSPMYKVKGPANQLPKKDDTGKMLILPIVETQSGKLIEADVDVISWDRAPEAIKLELDIGRGLIYGLTKTADLWQETLKGLGTNMSGVALQMMFFGSIVKSYFDQGDYRIVVSRILSVIMSGMANITKELNESALTEIQFDIKFTSILPDNLIDIVNMLSTATGGKPIMSQATAVRNNPIVEDAEDEIAQIKQEEQADSFNLTQ